MSSLRRGAAALRRNAAAQDYVVVAFLLVVSLMQLVAARGPEAALSRPLSAALLGASLVAVALVRGEALGAGTMRALVYRLGIFAPVALTYFVLRPLFPSVEDRLVDARLLAIDEALLGTTPSRVLEPWSRAPAVVEWFAFFYYSYYFLLSTHLVGSLLFDRGRRLSEIMFGALTITCAGHLVYFLVPAVGPAFACDFAHPVSGGFFWRCVSGAVHETGARIDVFPSLHTALPSFFALHSLRHRAVAPFRWTWPIAAFFAANIVVATMLLRWHYAVDVAAGLLLAIGAQQLAVNVARREEARREAGLQPLWEPLRRRQETGAKHRSPS